MSQDHPMMKTATYKEAERNLIALLGRTVAAKMENSPSPR